MENGNLSKNLLYMVPRGVVYSTLYKTQVKPIKDGLNVVENDAFPNLWHKRLAHLSEKGLQILSRKSLILSDKGNKLNPCDYFLFGEKHRVSFCKTSKLKDNISDIMYSNVCRPMEVDTLGGRKYFVTFIDDASGMVWVYFLKIKDEMF